MKKQIAEDDALGVRHRGIVTQKLLKGIQEHGDTRVHLINGKVCLIGQKRIPKLGSKLANVKAGASFEFTVLNEAEVRTCVEFAKQIAQYRPVVGSSHIGIDILKDGDSDKPLVSEINTWNICFIAETCDFLDSFELHTEAEELNVEYLDAVEKYRTSDIRDFVLLTEDISWELVGKYLTAFEN